MSVVSAGFYTNLDVTIVGSVLYRVTTEVFLHNVPKVSVKKVAYLHQNYCLTRKKKAV